MRKNIAITKNNINKNGFSFLSVLKGALIAVTVSLISILIFALVIKFITIPDAAIKPVNQIIKGLSILMGCIFGLKKDSQMGLIKGLLIGIFYTITSFIIFSILDGSFVFNKTILNDLMFSSIMGAICGIIVVNFKRK